MSTLTTADQQQLRLLSSVDSDATPLLRLDIPKSLSQRPTVAGRIADGALALAVGEVVWLSDDLAAVAADAFAQRGNVVDSKHHRLRSLLAERRDTAMSDVSDDQRALAECQLRAVSWADPDALDEPQHPDKPIDRRTDIRVGELWNHRTERR
jgi:hypothetical protein